MTTPLTPQAMKVGGRYNWQNQPDRLIYLGRSGSWHQFSKIGDPRPVWCEVLAEDLPMLEETASHWVLTYNTKYVDRLGMPRENKSIPFTEVQAESIDTALEPCGLSRASAQRLVDKWNRLARMMGTEHTYSIDPE